MNIRQGVVALMNSNMKKENLFVYIIGGFIVLSMVGVIVLLFFFPEKDALLDQAVNSLIVNFTLIVGYYFGSSQGSSDKNKMLNEKGKKE